ncbi:MAG: hypothetical protein PUK09_05885 [Bacilli bacterium]|nr:hypothetical protein [Bacilli bacterium]
MNKKELDEEIEFAHNNRTNKRLLRPLDVMRKVICNATNTYTNISLFMNDFIQLYDDKSIDKEMFNETMNDLYLLALLHTGYKENENE